MNLLQETKDVLDYLGKTEQDVAFVGAEGVYFTWDDFVNIANTEYDEGFGAQKVVSDLIVVSKDGWWLDRNEYDGSEGWNINTPPTIENRQYVKPDVLTIDQFNQKYHGFTTLSFFTLEGKVGWESFAGLNNPEKVAKYMNDIKEYKEKHNA